MSMTYRFSKPFELKMAANPRPSRRAPNPRPPDARGDPDYAWLSKDEPEAFKFKAFTVAAKTIDFDPMPARSRTPPRRVPKQPALPPPLACQRPAPWRQTSPQSHWRANGQLMPPPLLPTVAWWPPPPPPQQPTADSACARGAATATIRRDPAKQPRLARARGGRSHTWHTALARTERCSAATLR